ncbi:DUF3488 and transglutaminase-like domain-containing protein [Undibacterium sp.]|jgi:transglutaminase-like putative cysteine protease|uniref:transglutaminase TgpA family protein n=1 Tax=Undibacterium sp. TaxID=1914977 RepID=UPI002BBD2483|nr:DUF3488 and transglutaminase-like domain-containing protein [Undibacterium sp.]HTD04254.1 DUF3488 and transglutaminase-like domain-containing protein [Undibacterium sp.]
MKQTMKREAPSPLAGLHANWRKQPLSRDKADTLLLLLACVLVIVPHSAHLAWWTNAACAGLLAWRGWLTLTGRRLPPSWVLIPVSLLMMAGVYAGYGSFFGRDTGVAMLVLLLICKLLEMHARRDFFVVLFLSFFLQMTGFFYSQTMGAAVWSIVTLVLLLTAQLSFHYTGTAPSLWQRLKLGALILGLAIPLTVVAFVLFPRMQGPLWGLPGDANAGRSGLSDSMSPGNISSLALSDDIAFRVKFAGTAPPKSLLYWRGIILDQFDGRSWTQNRQPVSGSTEVSYRLAGEPIAQEIILEPSEQRWLFALDLPKAAPQPEGAASHLSARMELRTAQPVGKRLRYQVTSYPHYALQTEINPNLLSRALELPPGYNRRTLAYAAELRKRFKDDAQIVNAVLQFFRAGKFSYTLDPPLLGENSVDDFLFNTREGFCEHYASSFVVLMRAAGVPARVVTGYQGGALNMIDGYLEVRQADAHAWAEVWLAGRGWLRVDPTAAVAPGRVSLNTPLPRHGIAGMFSMGGGSVLANLRMRWDALNNGWNQWVLNYNNGTQRDLLRALGFSDVDWPKLILLLFLAGSVAIGAIALPLMLNRVQIAPLDRVYFLLCRKMARKGYPRAQHEGPHAYAERLKAALPVEAYAPVQKFLALYSATKYGKDSPPEAAIVSRLKTLLAQCR